MLRRVMSRLSEERGVALITAMLVSMVVVTLGVTSVTLAMHNTEQSARSRERVESIAVAEAGINYYFSHLQSGAADTFQCSITRSLAGTPDAQFQATVTFYDEDLNEIPCETLTADSEPDSARIRSIGTSIGEDPARTMEAFVNLIPIRGTPFGDFAVYSDASPTFNSNTQIFGGDSHDGNVYTNGNAVVESNAQMYGDVWAQGFVQLEGNSEVKEDVWSGTYVQLDTGSRVLGNARAATSYLNLGTGAHVFGDGRAGGPITLGSGAAIDGLQVPNTATDPPDPIEFPVFTYNPAAWANPDAGAYNIQLPTTCLAARTFINSGLTGNWVVRIPFPCDLNITTGQSPTLRGNLAIISDGSLTMSSNSEFKSDGGNHTLHLIFGLGEVDPCGIRFNSNTRIASGIKALLYTPCDIDLNSNSLVVEGQMFAGGVNFNSNSDLTFDAIDVPGIGASRFDEDIRYIREVVTG
jgi:cytoskeletal protein CcmA (bactofilin family)